MRTCRRCKRELPLTSFPKLLGTEYRSITCEHCVSRMESPPPDHRPAVRMRAALVRRRREGHAWDDRAFDDLIEAVLRGLHPDQREGWAEVLGAHRACWRSAYERTAAVLSLTVDLIDD
jgi:hypothetical protein